MMKNIKYIFLFLTLFMLIGGLSAQTEFPNRDFWSLDGGIGMDDILVEGSSYQIIIDPKLWILPAFMVGSKIGVNFSSEKKDVFNLYSNIVTFEGQVYLRWNFLHFGSNPDKKILVFAQSGIGLIAAYRGVKTPFDDARLTRGSLLFDLSVGITIPINSRWHIEPSIRGGYPHIFGVSVTTGIKFPLQKNTGIANTAYRDTSYLDTPYLDTPYLDTVYQDTTNLVITPDTEYAGIIQMVPHEEIIKRTLISSIEFILFGPDIGVYNAGIDNDARGLNELTLNSIARLLDDNRDFVVRIEGHANPVTDDPGEADVLMALGATRAHAVADQLRARDVNEEQMVIITYGGTRTVTSDHDIWNRNRRVELMVMKVDADTEQAGE